MNSKPGDERHLLQAQASSIVFEKPRENGQPGGRRRTQKDAEVVVAVGATSRHSHLAETALALGTHLVYYLVLATRTPGFVHVAKQRRSRRPRHDGRAAIISVFRFRRRNRLPLSIRSERD